MDKIEKCSKTQLNRIVIHKENNEKRIYSNELDYYLKSGWLVGMSDAHKTVLSQKKLNHAPWNKGIKGSVKPNSGTYYKGMIPWNKGLSGKKLPLEKLVIFRLRIYETKKNNNSFNISKSEEIYYLYLCKTYGTINILRQYKDKRYPFNCDFYIKSEDLFIECNFHWTHGFMPYNESDIKCIEKLNLWKEKAKTSKFYENAIYTWTFRDVEKLRIAQENHLNYKVIYRLIDNNITA